MEISAPEGAEVRKRKRRSKKPLTLRQRLKNKVRENRRQVAVVLAVMVSVGSALVLFMAVRSQ